MRKFLISVAALAVAGAASAQSSVTLFGVLDTPISGYKFQSRTPLGESVTVTQIKENSGGIASSRLGFRGEEDLGRGNAASFWLEAGFPSNNGLNGYGLFFTRRSTVSLSSVTFGELRLGHDYVPTFWNDDLFDPFNTNGVGTSLISTATTNRGYLRADNSVGYFLPPNLGGVYGQLMYAFDGVTSYEPGGLTPPGLAAITAKPALAAVADNARAGRYVGGRFGYADGPVDVAFAYAQNTLASNYYLGTTTKLDIWSLGASYDFGVVKLFSEYSNDKQQDGPAANSINPPGDSTPGFKGALIGFSVPIRVSLIRVSYSFVRYNNRDFTVFGTPPISVAGSDASRPSAGQFAIGYVYNLSRRTAVYATFAYINNKNGAALGMAGSPDFYTGTGVGGIGSAVPGHGYGYDLGIRHVF